MFTGWARSELIGRLGEFLGGKLGGKGLGAVTAETESADDGAW